MNNTRRQTLSAGIALLAAAAWPAARAQSPYPNALVKFVIPTSAGGGTDMMMRPILDKLSQALGQPAIVDFRPGAGGAIAAAAVAKSPPDGHTLLIGYSSLLSNLVLMPHPGYKLSELVPVCMLAVIPIAIAVRASLGVNTLQQYIALAKSRPKKLTYGVFGKGSSGHFVGELLNQGAGIETLAVPYKGEGQILTDLLGGHLDAAIISIGSLSRHLDRIKLLAVASPQRFSLNAEVPTFVEAGLPTIDSGTWVGVFAPAGTPKPIVDKLATELARIVKLPDVASKVLGLSFQPVGGGPDKLAEVMKVEYGRIQKLVAEGRVKPD